LPIKHEHLYCEEPRFQTGLGNPHGRGRVVDIDINLFIYFMDIETNNGYRHNHGSLRMWKVISWFMFNHDFKYSCAFSAKI